MPYLVSVVLSILTIVATYILHRRFANHKLSIGRISILTLSLHDIKYTAAIYRNTYHITFTASRIFLQFHFPRSPNPRWLTFTAQDMLYKSETCDVSASEICTIFWFFPVLFRQTVGPWTNAELHDIRIRIVRSDTTPYWIKRLRQNLVGAVVAGDIFTLDDFGTTARFSGLSEAGGEENVNADGIADSSLGEDFLEKQRDIEAIPFLKREQDEVRLSAFARGLHLHNHEGRVYSFGSVDAQLRRNWTANRGTFVMIAKESRWIRVPWSYQMQSVSSWWMQLASSIAHFPYDLVHVINYPMTSVNLYVTRVDITFDNFRIRDAELVKQAFSMLREKMAVKDVQWSDILVDFITNAIVGSMWMKDS